MKTYNQINKFASDIYEQFMDVKQMDNKHEKIPNLTSN